MECNHAILRRNGTKKSGRNRRLTFYCPDCKKQFNFPHSLTVEYLTRVSSFLRAGGLSIQTIGSVLGIPQRTLQNYLRKDIFSNAGIIPRGIKLLNTEFLDEYSEPKTNNVVIPHGFIETVLTLMIPLNAGTDNHLSDKKHLLSFLNDYGSRLNPDHIVWLIRYERAIPNSVRKAIKAYNRSLTDRWNRINTKNFDLPEKLFNRGWQFLFDVKELENVNYKNDGLVVCMKLLTRNEKMN